MTKDRITISFLGRELGTASGWDGEPGECVWFYDFQPKGGVSLPACSCFTIDEDQGVFRTGDEDDLNPPYDIVETLRDIPKAVSNP